MPRKKKTWRELLADEIVEALFVNGAGQKGKRLILELEDGRDGGGWSKGPVRDVIIRHLRDEK